MGKAAYRCFERLRLEVCLFVVVVVVVVVVLVFGRGGVFVVNYDASSIKRNRGKFCYKTRI